MFGNQTKTLNNPKNFLLNSSQVDGATYVSAIALEAIASLAVKDIKGVVNLHGTVYERANSLISKSANEAKGVDVTQDPDGKLNFLIHVSLEFGVNIPKTAISIQEAVKTAVNQSTDLDVKNVDLVIENYVVKTASAKKTSKSEDDK
ncbi:MAG: Asp23/Gls24 family envelope stress response protein [Lactobacillaceae bacterium]|jgi:uncharacterized alkaline shock family protein YloU|nr:Asp23/Gls24 family envelope stress response protein [Lactobacillaceae bacterium]